MGRRIIAALAVLALGGCQQGAAPVDGHAGTTRFAGVGVFEAGPGWHHIATAPAPGDPAQAKIADDEHVIVTIDGRSGEIRQCGDHSGYCVAIKAWARPEIDQAPSRLARPVDDAATPAR